MSQTCIFCVDAPELDFDFCRVCGRGLPENPCGEVISTEEYERVSARLAFIRASESPKTGNSCASHCCPVHGCKYAYDQPEWQEHEFVVSGYVHHCPVSDGTLSPEHPENNGCEWCELERDNRVNLSLPERLTPELWEDIEYFLRAASVRDDDSVQFMGDEADSILARLEGTTAP